MKQLIIILTVCFLLTPVLGFAHHPAADMVDAEIYALIEEMVSETPHADLEFISMGSVDMTIITTDTVSAAEDLIDEGLIADISLLDGDVSVSIEFLPEPEVDAMDFRFPSIDQDKSKKSDKKMKWSEWGGPVKITITQDTSN